jgi:GNAT superfamily N-acetyltransferase
LCAADALQLERLSEKFGLSSFDCGDDELDDFLQSDALQYQEDFLANTTLMLVKGEMVGYFSLAADAIRLSADEKNHDAIETPFSSFPALKIARLAVDARHQDRGYGTRAVKYCIGLARHLNDEHRHDGIACRFVTVDAYPQSAAWYMNKFGFIENESGKSRRETVSLRLDALPIED